LGIGNSGQHLAGRLLSIQRIALSLQATSLAVGSAHLEYLVAVRFQEPAEAGAVTAGALQAETIDATQPKGPVLQLAVPGRVS